MIAGAPLSPDGLACLAALIARHGPRAQMTETLAAAVRAHTSGSPEQALASAAANRRRPPPNDRPYASGRSPAARFLRRLGRRPLVRQSDAPVPTFDTPAELAAALASADSAAERRDLVAHSPLAWRR